jgi:hypothetical protein
VGQVPAGNWRPAVKGPVAETENYGDTVHVEICDSKIHSAIAVEVGCDHRPYGAQLIRLPVVEADGSAGIGERTREVQIQVSVLVNPASSGKQLGRFEDKWPSKTPAVL